MKFLRNLSLDDLVFIDIETAQLTPKLEKDTPLYESWEYKMKFSKDAVIAGEKTYEEMFDTQAQLYPEFAKIICITIGKIKDGVLKIHNFSSHNEQELLANFNSTMNNIIAANKNTKFCGHFIIGFDIPFILARSIVNQVEPCNLIDIGHLKPWEVTAIDTQTLWKATSFRSASLINIAVALGLPSPKDEMFGYESSKVYYNEENGLERITKYCGKDVLTVANIVRKCRFEPIVNIEIAEIKEKEVGLVNKLYNTGTLSKGDENLLMVKLNNLPEEDRIIANEILSIAKKTK